MTFPTKQLTIIIPAYNEGQSIATVVHDVFTECNELIHEVIVVDDGSSDQTASIAETTSARVIRHSRNQGYGAALKTGIHAAQTEFVLTMDSDGQHKAQFVKQLWQIAEESDMVVGERTALIHSPLWRMPGKWLLGKMADYMTRTKIPDLNSGLRLMRRDVVLKYIHLCPSGFSFSTTITIALLKRGYRVQYVPIQVEKRIGKSKVSLSTGLDTLILILRLASLFDPLRIFLPFSIVITITGIMWGLPLALLGRGVSVGAMLAVVTGVLLFVLGLMSDQISQLRLERFE